MSIRTHATRRRLLTGAASAGLMAGALVTPALTGATTAAGAAAPAAATCQLGNGISHVINIVFDNVHFGRDNPNVPSDLERMPALMDFMKNNGTILSNTHTPMIAHTADDSLTIYTGLYGDRHGQPLSNSYKGYNPDGTTDPAASFAYWTSPFADTAATPTPGHDNTPSMVYSDTVPASGAPDRQTPAPWVPFTRAGCNVGDFSTANMVLENAKVDLPTIFGPNSPEVQQYNADTDSFKDAEVADYIGEAVHCAQGSSFCADAQATKFGQTSPTPSAVTDSLPTEPGGYNGYQALFGAKYLAPQLSDNSTPNLVRNGYQITDAQGNLVDLNGQTIRETFSGKPGFPGFSPTATQSLAYLADMQESGIPITYGYISDLHERKAGTSDCTSSSATLPGRPIGPGDSCYKTNGDNYNQAFQTFFQRLAADGINASNTLFIIGSEEGDQFAGASANRFLKPTPATCDGSMGNFCSYPAGSIGELQANIKGLLAGTSSANTAYDIEPQGASIYAHGQPGLHDATLRQLERDTAAMRGDNPYSGETNQRIVKYQAGAVEERILHMQTADPLRMPSYTMFPVPDYFFSTTGAPVSINAGFAYDHGYYSPNIDVTWSSFAGPGVKNLGIDGPTPEQSNEASDPNSTRTVPEASTQGTWVEETDLRPTMLHLLGLSDDYSTDGQVVSQVLADPSKALTDAQALGAAYQQINSSVGTLATITLEADSRALASGSATNDGTYDTVEQELTKIANRRDVLATEMKAQLARAAAGHQLSRGDVQNLIAQADSLIRKAQKVG
ncbi:MAG: hypothetical protein J2P22_04940 [Nocardioides sp.]|nr:hypothetical protein [Nocardioides sp.]